MDPFLAFAGGVVFAAVLVFIFQEPLILHARKTSDQSLPPPTFAPTYINDPLTPNSLLAYSLVQNAEFIESQRQIFPRHLHNDFDDCIADINLASERLAVTIEGEEVFDPSTTDRIVSFGYTNYRGEYGIRKAIIVGTRWGRTPWHPEHGFLLRGFDIEKQEIREFALKDCNFTVTF